jgi:hypothetical protein
MRPAIGNVVDPRTVNVDVAAPHGVTSGELITTKGAPSATTNVRVKSSRRTGRHATDTRCPMYWGHETARVRGGTRTGARRSAAGGFSAGGVVAALGGISDALGADGTTADGSAAREGDGGPADALPSQAATQ